MKLSSKKLNLTPAKMKMFLRIFVPYIGSGIKVTYISDNWRELHVQMKLSWYNLNAFGTHFGGSLYAMIDPHYTLLMMQSLGHGYYVWDKSATIDFIKPGLGTVKAQFKIEDSVIEQVLKDSKSGKPCYPEFDIEIKNAKNEVVAKVHKILYVKKKNVQ